MFSKLPLEDFVKELSSKAPTPGGGSASSIVAAFSFSLITKTLEIANKKVQSKDIQTMIEKARELIDYFLELADKDTDAFNEVMKAYKLPRENEEERAVRELHIQESLKLASEVPLELLKHIAEHIQFLEESLRYCPNSAISDYITAIGLLEGAFEGGMANVIINLNAIKDRTYNENVRSVLNRLESDFKNSVNAIKKDAKYRLNVQEGE